MFLNCQIPLVSFFLSWDQKLFRDLSLSLDLTWSGCFFTIEIFFIESSLGNKKNVIIKLFEPSERRKYIFCDLKSVRGVSNTPGARVFAQVLRYMRNQYFYRNIIVERKIGAPVKNIFLTQRKFIYINGRTTKTRKVISFRASRR